ncbi:hypothetical protein [Streptomyces sp. NPDC047928]|uniref:hypothetical protein n=1 Tax=unclassified Streptomyces TaxID=2593676 RepID=UPI00371BBF68
MTASPAAAPATASTSAPAPVTPSGASAASAAPPVEPAAPAGSAVPAGSVPDSAGEVVRWAAFSCALVPFVLLVYGTSFGGAAATALGLAAVTAACRTLLRRSERLAAVPSTEPAVEPAVAPVGAGAPHRGRHSRTGAGAHRGGRHGAGCAPGD